MPPIKRCSVDAEHIIRFHMWTENFCSFFAPKVAFSNLSGIRELKQPRRRRQQKPHKFAYLTTKNRIFARFARAFFKVTFSDDVLASVDVVFA